MDSAGSLSILAVGEIEGDFFVPSYQRGYRWTNHEVGQLLTDIRESAGTTYYLQPLVVKARTDGSWELVDGQQRLTTLYLIFQYLARTHLPTTSAGYTLSYETREGSEEYLQELDEERAGTNIDYFHIFQAYRHIERWFDSFERRAAHEASQLHSYLFDHVKVLWYEAPEDVDPTDLFTRLNVGRIPLTDAELVKALLLSRGQSGVGQTDRSLEIAASWDGIERDLRQPEVWSFVTGKVNGETTHISLLLDTLAGGPAGAERPLFHTFESLRHEIEEDPQAFWRKVVDLHSLVLGWYEDRDLFHKVGYLIAIGMSFDQLVALSTGKGRTAFEAALDDEIRRHLNLTRDDLADLTYPSSAVSHVLLLLNVETIRAMQDSSERYSFRAHAAGSWSLEHIHAQNAEPLTTTEQWRAWLEYHRNALAGLPDSEVHADLLARVEEVLAGDVTQQAFTALEQELIAALSPADGLDEVEVDSIANLALLDHRDNAALNNSVFEVKRRDLIRRDKAGSYIPASTRNVFLKYYTDSGSQQLQFWSGADRQAYLAAVEVALAPYLRTEEGEEMS